MFNSNRAAITDDISSPSVEDAEPRTYQERKERGICTYAGCPELACEDGGECEMHRDKSRSRKRRSRRRWRSRRNAQRKTWSQKRLCFRCGGKRVAAEEHCAKCLVVRGAALARAADKRVDNKRDRIADRTTIDADGRSRYRGQAKRGRQSVAQVDEQDLRYALESIQKAKDGLAFVAALPPGMPRVQKQDAIHAALSLADQGARFIDEVLGRHNYFGDIAPTPSKIGR